ncbi:MAG: response regulator [Pontiellaceae bacterium]|nr:response regulator [Pontiellaceae bacterium]
MRESKENLRVTLKSIGDGVISTDVECRIIGMNLVAESLTGWSLEDAVGRKLTEVFNIVNAHTRKPQKNPVEEAMEKDEIVALSNHTILISKSGREYQIADSSAPIRDDEDCICGVVMVFRDVTEEYALQEQLRQSQKMDAIGQLAGGVAHDLNNMLGGIMGGAELLKEILSPQDEAAEFIGIIEESARRAAGLTGRLLAFARRQPVASSPVDVHHVIEETQALLRQTIDKRIRIESRLEAEASTVVGDNAQLQSVFMNLGINAAQAMEEGGSIVFSTRLTEVSNAQTLAEGQSIKAGSYLQVAVRDTGSGIAPENLGRIFEPFFTTKSVKGTGLGLAAAYGTVSQHGGSISVYSELGEGTVFHILLPLTREVAAALPAPAEPVHGEGVILLVDDEPIMRATGAAFLKEFGYQVLLAENGRQAIDLITEKGSEIDLVVLDMIMPEMNGRDCFFLLRETYPNLPVIVSSGFSRAEDLEDMKKSGLSGFIQKPFRGVDFSGVVAAALKGAKRCT